MEQDNTVSNGLINTDLITQLLCNINSSDQNEDIHTSAYELAYDTIPEMFVPVSMIIINGKINGSAVKILVDTGASVSIIMKNKVVELGMSELVDPKGAVVHSGIGNEVSPGTLWLVELEINNNIFPIKLSVTQTHFGDFDMIIGLDFLRSYKAHINFVSNIITLNEKYHINF